MGYDGDKFVWENRHVCTPHTCIGEILYQPGGTCGPRVQRDYELVFLHSGELTVLVDDRAHTVQVGQAALFLPGHRESFQFSRTRETHHSWCSLAPALMPRRMRTVLARAAFTIPCSEPITHLLAAGLAIRAVQNRHTRQLVDYIGLSLFAEFLEDAAQQTAGATMDITVTHAVRFLAEHLAEKDCLQKTHQAVGVSRNTLIKRFHHDLKTTPARYLWRLRTERGIKLLAETGHTINEIAFQCGFQSPFHFSRLVRKLQGCSPREVRRRAWGN